MTVCNTGNVTCRTLLPAGESHCSAGGSSTPSNIDRTAATLHIRPPTPGPTPQCESTNSPLTANLPKVFSVMEHPLYSRSRRLKKQLAAFVALIFASMLCIVGRPASADEDDIIWCYSGDDEQEIWYLGDPFVGDYLYESTRAKLDFHTFLKSQGNSPNFLYTFCWKIRDKRHLEYKIRRLESYPYEDWYLVSTKWKPGYSGPLPQDDSNDSRGRESGRDGCYFGECPDDTSSAPRSSQRGLACETQEGWCKLSAAQQIGATCACSNRYGRRIYGTVAQSRP